MKPLARGILIGTLLGFVACSGDEQPAPPPSPGSNLAAPTPKAVILVTEPKTSNENAYYWGTILNDVPPDQPATTATPETKAEGTPPPDATPVVGNYRVETPFAFRFKDMQSRSRLGVTSFGEVVFSVFSAGLRRVTLWNPAKSITEEVTILQHRKGSGDNIFYDQVNDQLVFVETDKDGKKHLMTRTIDGKENEIAIEAANSGYSLKGLIPVGDGFAVLAYGNAGGSVSGTSASVAASMLPPSPAVGRIHLVNLKSRAIQPLCAQCTDFVAAADPQAPFVYYVSTKDGEQRLVNLLDGQTRTVAASPADGKTTVTANSSSAPYIAATKEVVFRRSTTTIGADNAGAAVTVELVALDTGSGAMRTLVTWAEPTINDLKTGPKVVTKYDGTAAHIGDRYLLVGADDRCEKVGGSGTSCAAITSHYSWVGTDGKIQPIVKYDWTTEFVAYAAKSNRLVLGSHGDLDRLLVVDAGTGKELANLERMSGTSIAAYGKGAGADFRWENREFFLTTRETEKEETHEIGVLSQYQIDHLTEGASLTPAVLTTVHGTPKIFYVIDWATGKGRSTAVAADTTPAPESTTIGGTGLDGGGGGADGSGGGGGKQGTNASPTIDAAILLALKVTKTGIVSVKQYVTITDPEGDPIVPTISCPGILPDSGVALSGQPTIVADTLVAGATHRYDIAFKVTNLPLLKETSVGCQIQAVDAPVNLSPTEPLHLPVTHNVKILFQVNTPPVIAAVNFSTDHPVLFFFQPVGDPLYWASAGKTPFVVPKITVTDPENNPVTVQLACANPTQNGGTWPQIGVAFNQAPTYGLRLKYALAVVPAAPKSEECTVTATETSAGKLSSSLKLTIKFP